MKQVTMTLTGRRQLTHDVYELIFSGDTSSITAPGQFVNIQVPGNFLRRPISVCDWSDDRLVLICRAMGQGTQTLCAAVVGAEFDMLTGLGNGYDLSEIAGKKPVLIGGGVGVPPLYGLARRLIARGIVPAVALGFNSAGELFYEKEFEALGCPVSIATVDGSVGQKGFVTQLVASLDCDYAFCCGPMPMLRAVSALEQLWGGQYSLEERMGCGFGACVGCTIETRDGPRRVCKDGPVFRKEAIIW